jgi:K+-transporting ATPase ATPase A chain
VSGQGITQIVFYAVALVALGYPLGIWMSRVYLREREGVVERGFYRLLGRNSLAEQDWKTYGKNVLVFSVLFSLVVYGIQRLQGHLFLNPDHMRGVAPHIALNTTASFVTNTNWQYYGGEFTMSYLTQMAGLAVQNFVSAGVGMAVLAAVSRADRRTRLGTSGATSTGRSSSSCFPCRSSSRRSSSRRACRRRSMGTRRRPRCRARIR